MSRAEGRGSTRLHYRIGSVDEFWEWLVHQGEEGNIKIPIEIYEEVKAGNDELAAWTKESETEAALKLTEDVKIDLVRKVTEEGYAPDLSDIEIEGVGRDPFYCLRLSRPGRTVNCHNRNSKTVSTTS